MNVISPKETSQANYLNFDAKYCNWMWSLIKRSYFDVKRAFFVRIFKGGIELFKKCFKVVEQGWLMLQQRCEPRKGRAWQQGANESYLTWVSWILMTMKSDDQTHLVDKILIECMPSNLSSRLICGSFGWVMFPKRIPKKSKLDWFTNEP
jgi:hypothetical protein